MFDQADKGTLYIHDIDKLNRVAQKIMYEEIKKVVDAPVADKNPRLIICATNKSPLNYTHLSAITSSMSLH